MIIYNLIVWTLTVINTPLTPILTHKITSYKYTGWHKKGVPFYITTKSRNFVKKLYFCMIQKTKELRWKQFLKRFWSIKKKKLPSYITSKVSMGPLFCVTQNCTHVHLTKSTTKHTLELYLITPVFMHLLLLNTRIVDLSLVRHQQISILCQITDMLLVNARILGNKCTVINQQIILAMLICGKWVNWKE